MANFARTSTLMKKIPHNNSNVRNSMVLVWYSELFGALRYKLIWGGELDLSPPKLDLLFVKNRKIENGVPGIWTQAQKHILVNRTALYQLSHEDLVKLGFDTKNHYLCTITSSNPCVPMILVKFIKSAIF